jgi:hypothetical protein
MLFYINNAHSKILLFSLSLTKMNHPGSNSMAIDMALLVALCLWAGGGGRPGAKRERERFGLPSPIQWIPIEWS